MRSPVFALAAVLPVSLVLLIGFVLPSSAFAGWILQDSGTSANLYGVNAHHGTIDTAWACGAEGTILYTSDGGATWTSQDSGTQVTLYSIVFVEQTGAVIAVGEAGTLLKSMDSGLTWNAMPTGTDATLYDVAEFRYLAVGEEGTILRSTDFGATWNSVPSPTALALYSVTGGFAEHAVGEAGTILRGLNQGTSWIPLSSGTSLDLFGLPLFGSLNLTVGDDGLILRSTNSGANWFADVSHTAMALRATEFSNPMTAYCVGDGGTIRKTTNGGAAWVAQSNPTVENLNDVFFYLDDSRGWAVGDQGTILRTNDGGGTPTAARVTDAIVLGAHIEDAGPNPVRERAEVFFRIVAPCFARLRVLDVRGAEMAVLAKAPFGPGRQSAIWDASVLPSGVYFLRLEAGSEVDTVRRVKLR